MQRSERKRRLACCIKVVMLMSVVAAVGPSALAATCPPSHTILPCRCSNVADDTQIWCSYSNLPSVMGALHLLGTTLLSTVDELILEGNNLPSLPGRNFEGLQIVRLMLRDNGLERVTSNWLGTLESTLHELFIIEPRLRTLPADILDRFLNLEAVTFQAGLMKRAPRFAHLPKLRYVQLQSPILTEMTHENFEDLPNLEQLHIVGSPLLTKLDAGLLRDLPKLSQIDISNCSVNWLHPKTFYNLQSVREMSLMWNRISDAGVIGRACRELRNLQIIRLDNNFIDRLIEGSFVDLPALQELYLSGNMISEIHGGAFRNVPSLKILDLNKNLLRRVNAAAFLYPSGSSLEELWLIDNQLYQVSELKALFNSLPRLRFLDMSKNHMEELPFDVLRGHPTLERLHLNENRIKRLPKKAFAGMTSLRELRLRNNSISDYPTGAAWNLPSLMGLDMSQNKIRRLDSRLMTYLPSLRRLDLSENFIDTVLPDTFTGNLNLETINLSKNFVTSFHALTFSHLPKLYELDASWNRLREVVQGLPRDIEHLRLGQNQIFTLPAPPTELNLPHLRLLDLNGNALQIIQQNTFASMSRLQILHLNDNLLQAIEQGSLNGLSRLEILNLRNNRLRDINGDNLKGLKGLKEINLQGNNLEIIARGILEYSPKLESIKLGNNKIAEIQTGAFSNARELQELNLTHNYLDRFPEAVQGLKMLRSLDISHNNVRSVQPHLFQSLPSLAELHFAHNKLYDLSANIFNDLQKLEFLDLSNNELENLSARSISSLPSLVALQLGGNRLSTIQEEAFVDLPELQSLDLQSNNLQAISEKAFMNIPHISLLNLSHNLFLDVEKAGLRELRSLEVLDLSDNKVASIDSSNFRGMDWLVELKLDKNIICHIHGAPFNDLHRLRVLSLRNNRMTTVTESAFQQLRNNIVVLDIDGNPLSCSCRMLWLQAWLQDTTTDGPHCRDGSLFRDARLSRTDCAHSRIVEPVVPGCEEHNHHAPNGVQILSLSQTNVSLPQSMNLKATENPQSEYVYDEYMEYEEVNGTEATPSFIPVDVTAGEMKGSPHLTSGDTPTIYAQQKPPKLDLSNPGLGYEDLKKAQQLQTPQGPSQSGYSGLSFFGIPLPSFGNIWKGRSSENSYKRGKVQPVNPSSRHRAPNFVTLGPPGEETTKVSTEPSPPYTTPPNFETGFLPMLPKTTDTPQGHWNEHRDTLETNDKPNTPASPLPHDYFTESAPRNRDILYSHSDEDTPGQNNVPNTIGRSVPQLPLQPTLASNNLMHPHLTPESTLYLDVFPPTLTSDDRPSSDLPREHRIDEDAPKWELPNQLSTLPPTRDAPHPGRVEPILKKEIPTESTTHPPQETPLEANSSSDEGRYNFPPDEPNYSIRSSISEDIPLDRISLDNELTQSEPTIHKYMSSDTSSWYFKNYNRSNIQPFIERTYDMSAGDTPAKHFSLNAMILIVVLNCWL